MPYCEVQPSVRNFAETDTERVQIYYQTYGHGDIKVLLIMGLAATHEGWNPQILSLVGSTTPNEEDDFAERLSIPCLNSQRLHDLASLEESRQRSFRSEGIGLAPSGIHVCAFDNRGVGKSSSPRKKSDYTTTIMAMDALAVMDRLGWGKVHVFGHSLGYLLTRMQCNRGHDILQVGSNVSRPHCLPGIVKCNWGWLRVLT